MYLEHVNITVPNPRGIANALCRLFGWHVRWEGEAKDNGYSVHVGDDKSYLALYEPACELEPEPARYTYVAGLNHVGVVVDDLNPVHDGVEAQGYKTYGHADYDPGRRFYFIGPAGIEFEVAEYD
ncbi:MAG: VOC family protein [Roseovarius sp.]|nr:VOC family protein [Roseovarius sp.]